MNAVSQNVKNIKAEMRKAVVGQEGIIDFLLITLLAESHAIIEGVPGLAKTLIINSLAKTLNLSFNRIQFTPDLVPSDITGTEIIHISRDGEKDFRFVKGPIFSQLVLADEINRTPPKTQSALLQAMQEKKVTILGNTRTLPEPFCVFATQNPIEYEGTYPLPEAQLDRFLLHIDIDYPSRDQEMQIVDMISHSIEDIKPVVEKDDLVEMLKAQSSVLVSDKVKDYVVDIVRNTRPDGTVLDLVKKHVKWGAGPRASQLLVKAAIAHAFIRGAKMVEKEDVDHLLVPALKHRLILNYQTLSEGFKVGDVIAAVKKSSEAKL